MQALGLVREPRHGKQDRFLVAGVDIDLVNRKTKAAIEVPIESPGDDGDIIVGKGNRGHRHDPLLRESR
jgi:hypothetical protein